MAEHWLTIERRAKRMQTKEADRKRGRHSKRKGKLREVELANELTELTGEPWNAGGTGGGRDPRPNDPNSEFSDHHLEAKARNRIGGMRWQEQAEKEGASRGKRRRCVVWREDAQPGQKKPPWIVQLPLTEYVADQLELIAFRAQEEDTC